MTVVGISHISHVSHITSWLSVRIGSRALEILKSKPKLILAFLVFYIFIERPYSLMPVLNAQHILQKVWDLNVCTLLCMVVVEDFISASHCALTVGSNLKL
jgi:hypothetical protein